MGLNYVAITGNCTRDPELRTTQSGMAILQIGLAFNDRRKDPQTGQWEDVPNYIDGILFGNRAEAMSRILTKGMHVAIQGKLRWSSWEDKNGGGKRSKIEVIIDEIDLMSPRQQGQYPQMPAQAPQMPQNAPQPPRGYPNQQQPQTAPQMASQQPMANPYGNYQPTQQPPQPQQSIYIEDGDIPFSGPYML